MEYHFNIKELQQQVEDVIRYSQNFQNLELKGIPTILKDWFDRKKFFIDLLGGNLIYQMPNPVSFELSDKAKQDKLNYFAGEVSDHYNNSDLGDFLFSISVKDFYNNLTSQEYSMETQQGELIVIPEKFKVVKAFKFFENNIDKLKLLQNEASRIIQENVVSGYLCFSVHPLDYLSISENVCNWRSCHALDGDYRSGNLNYMVDSTTVVCYLRAEKQAILPHFPEHILWNSKKWRVLLFFSNDKTLVFAGRQYPFMAEESLNIIKDNLFSALRLGDWTPWNNTLITNYTDSLSGVKYNFKSMMPIGETLKSCDEIIKDGKNTHHFNDLLRSSCYSPMWSYKRKNTYYLDYGNTGATNKFTEVVIGQACVCPICGKNEIISGDTMTCGDYHCGESSSEYWECEICGSSVLEDDLYILPISGLRICESCYKNETIECQECGIRDTLDKIKYHENSPRCLCPGCWQIESLDSPPLKIVF